MKRFIACMSLAFAVFAANASTLEWTGANVTRSGVSTSPEKWDVKLIDSDKVSRDEMVSAMKSGNYDTIAAAIKKGLMASTKGIAQSSSLARWYVSGGTLPSEYATDKYTELGSIHTYTLILDSALSSGSSGKYLITREMTSNYASFFDESIIPFGNVKDSTWSSYSTSGSSSSTDSDPSPSPSPSPDSGDDPDPEEPDDSGDEDDGDEEEDSSDFELPDLSSAQVYYGWLHDVDDLVAGTIQVKAAKEKKDTKTSKKTSQLTITIEIAGEKKVSIRGTYNFSTGTCVATAKDGRKLDLTIAADGIEGTFGDYTIGGMRDVFSSKNADDKKAAAAALAQWKKPLSIVWQTEDGSGYNVLSVTVASKGKAKITGTVDGNKVSTSAQLTTDGEDTSLTVAYSKGKVNLAFGIDRMDEGNDISIIGLEDPTFGESTSFEDSAFFYLEDTMTLMDYLGDEEGTFSDYLPNDVEITVKGTKWTLPKAGKVVVNRDGEVDETKLGDNPSGLKLTYKGKNGSFSGSFKAYVDNKGKPKAVTVSVSGVMIDGVGYGTATVKKKGSVLVTIK